MRGGEGRQRRSLAELRHIKKKTPGGNNITLAEVWAKGNKSSSWYMEGGGQRGGSFVF